MTGRTSSIWSARWAASRRSRSASRWRARTCAWWRVDGDGAALMRMGVFATLGAYGPANLTHVLLDNGAHDSTGGQATVSRNVSFAGVAAACGYASAAEGDRSRPARRRSCKAPPGRRPRPTFVCLQTRAGTPDGLPRPTVDAGGSQDAPGPPDRRRSKVTSQGIDHARCSTRAPSRSPSACAKSLLQTDLCHRESEFFDLQDEARARLLKIYALDPAAWSAVLMTGSGTAAAGSP